MQEKTDRPHAVYRFYDATGAVLYIGCSAIPFGARLQKHGCTKPWARDIVKATFEWYPSWLEGRKVEAAAILSEQPKYNYRQEYPEDFHPAKTAHRHQRGDGVTCPRCGEAKEVAHTNQAYCKRCNAIYHRELRLRKKAEGFRIY